MALQQYMPDEDGECRQNVRIKLLLWYTLLKMGSYSSTTVCQYWDNHLIY